MGNVDFVKDITKGIKKELNLLASIENDYNTKLKFVTTFKHRWKKGDFRQLNKVMNKIKRMIKFNEKGTTELQSLILRIVAAIEKRLESPRIKDEENLKLRAIRIRIIEAMEVFEKLSVIYNLQYAFFEENKDSLWKEKMNFHMFYVLVLREGALLGSGKAIKELVGIQKEIKDDLENYEKINRNKIIEAIGR